MGSDLPPQLFELQRIVAFQIGQQALDRSPRHFRHRRPARPSPTGRHPPHLDEPCARSAPNAPLRRGAAVPPGATATVVPGCRRWSSVNPFSGCRQPRHQPAIHRDDTAGHEAGPVDSRKAQPRPLRRPALAARGGASRLISSQTAAGIGRLVDRIVPAVAYPPIRAPPHWTARLGPQSPPPRSWQKPISPCFAVA